MDRGSNLLFLSRRRKRWSSFLSMLGIFGLYVCANNIPNSFPQFREWISKWLPGGGVTYTSCCATVCWAIWKCRNKACFENKIINSPIEIIIHICALLTYWSGLYNQETQGKILEGVQALLACAHRVMIGQAPATHPTRLLPPPEDLDEDDSEEWRSQALWREKRCVMGTSYLGLGSSAFFCCCSLKMFSVVSREPRC